MRYIKLFVLTLLLAGFFIVDRNPVAAARQTCYQQYAACYGDAQTARDNCYYMCSGIIACEAVCDGRYNDSTAQCDADYENCVD